jgi:pSer/pThr/pTyr-binding forkhead associated (FHA) protein
MARRGAKNFATDKVGKPKADGDHRGSTRVDAVYAGLQEGEGEESLFHSIVTDEFHIGRHPDSNLLIKADTKVSRRHATIVRKETSYFIEDNGSSNGTLVNGTKIGGRVELKVGDRIGIGKREFVFARTGEG